MSRSAVVAPRRTRALASSSSRRSRRARRTTMARGRVTAGPAEFVALSCFPPTRSALTISRSSTLTPSLSPMSWMMWMGLSEEASGLRYKGFLDLLMDLSADGALTDIEVRDQIEAILTTGFETTATQLTFTVLLLGAHPEIQEKMVKELEAVLGPDRDVGKDDLNKLVYTNAVIMESVRLFPTIPIILRCVDQDVKLKNFTMNAGSYCILFPLIPNIAARELNEDQFRPERWLEDDFNGHQDFAGFGLGKRGCLGKTYAIIAMKVLLANFMRQYRVRADMSQLQLSADFVLKPVSGHEISIERRHSTAA